MDFDFQFLRQRILKIGSEGGGLISQSTADRLANGLRDDLLTLQGWRDRRHKLDEAQEAEHARHAAELERIERERGNLIIDCEHWITETVRDPDEPPLKLRRCTICGFTSHEVPA
jgi:hypothetical protein